MSAQPTRRASAPSGFWPRVLSRILPGDVSASAGIRERSGSGKSGTATENGGDEAGEGQYKNGDEHDPAQEHEPPRPKVRDPKSNPRSQDGDEADEGHRHQHRRQGSKE
jgi:hypothetical protein